MREMTFKTVGVLPVSDARWHIHEGGGHIFFVSENPDIGAYALVDGVFARAVEAVENTDAPLVMPKVDA